MNPYIVKKIKIKLAKKEIIQMLKKHDWTYEMSEDQRKWDKGNKELEEIVNELKKIPVDEAYVLWNEYSPPNFKKEKKELEKILK